MRSPGSSPRRRGWRWSAWPRPSRTRDGFSSGMVPTSCLRNLSLGDGSALDLVRWVQRSRLSARIVVITGFDNTFSAVEALADGAMGYVLKAQSTKTCLPPSARWRTVNLTSPPRSPRSCPPRSAGGRSMRVSRSRGLEALSRREREIFRQMVEGYATAEMRAASASARDGRNPPNEHEPQARRSHDRRPGPIRGGPRNRRRAASARAAPGAGGRVRNLNDGRRLACPRFLPSVRRRTAARAHRPAALSQADVRVLDGGGLDRRDRRPAWSRTSSAIYSLPFGRRAQLPRQRSGPPGADGGGGALRHRGGLERGPHGPDRRAASAPRRTSRS